MPLGVLERRTLDYDVNLFSDEDATAVERSLKINAEVLAVELGRSFETQAGVAVLILLNSENLDIESDRLGYTLDGDVAGNSALGAIADFSTSDRESELRVIVHIEEVGALDVLIALFVCRIDGGSLGTVADPSTVPSATVKLDSKSLNTP